VKGDKHNPSLERTRANRSAGGEFVRQWRLARAAHADCWAIPRKAILAACMILLLVGSVIGAENSYDFTVTGEGGETLGSGKIHLPFKLGSDGKGTADWQFTPTQAVSTNKFWARAKSRLMAGKGKASAESKKAWFRLGL